MQHFKLYVLLWLRSIFGIYFSLFKIYPKILSKIDAVRHLTESVPIQSYSNFLAKSCILGGALI